MNEELMLSRSELAALDLLIDAMGSEKAAAALADPAAWIKAIAQGALKVTKKICPAAVQVTTQVLGAQVAQDPKAQQLAMELSGMPEPTLEQLIALRCLQREQ